MPQLTFANQIFCTVENVRRYYTSTELLFHKEITAGDIQIAIDDAKEIYLRQPLIAICQERFPDKIRSWQTSKRAQLDQRFATAERNIALAERGGRYPLNQVVSFDGQFFDMSALQNAIRPATFYFQGVPVNGVDGTYASSNLQAGDMLFNTLTDLGYINRGTGLSPLWQRFVADDGIDFILNPQELKWANIFATGKLMASKGFLESKPDYQNAAIGAFYQSASDLQYGDYKMALKNALPRIQFNISGTGTAIAYELGATDGEIVLF